MTNLQNKTYDIVNPVEIDKACEDIRLLLKNELTWISHPFHIAQRFLKRDANSGKTFFYPETYVKKSTNKGYDYHRLTPDNDYKGMFFFMVGPETQNDYTDVEKNFLTYNVGIIFSCNLELIDKARLNDYLFTQDLIKSVRRTLTDNAPRFTFRYNIRSITRDLRECYREFSLDDIEQYNRAPLQCFRIDLLLTLREEC